MQEPNYVAFLQHETNVYFGVGRLSRNCDLYNYGCAYGLRAARPDRFEYVPGPGARARAQGQARGPALGPEARPGARPGARHYKPKAMFTNQKLCLQTRFYFYKPPFMFTNQNIFV